MNTIYEAAESAELLRAIELLGVLSESQLKVLKACVNEISAKSREASEEKR